MSGGGGSSAPDPDPRIGEAALKSAEIGSQYLGFMKDQAAVTNRWAQEDRRRHSVRFKPLENEYVAEAAAGPDYAGVEQDVSRAGATARSQFAQAQEQLEREQAAMGVDPRSGRSRGLERRAELAEALGVTGAENTTRMQSRDAAEAEADAKRSNAINLGAGMAVNPATSMGLSNGAMSSGFSGAMSGQGQMGSMLGRQDQQRMQAWQADQQQSASTWGGLGQIAGLGISMLSSKDYKEDKRPARGVLEAVREMPVEEWKYKDGIGDGQTHVGPYAEDFHAATGKGDGKSIPVVDAVGLSLGSVQELDRKVQDLSRKQGGNADAPGDRRGSGPSPKSIMGAL